MLMTQSSFPGDKVCESLKEIKASIPQLPAPQDTRTQATECIKTAMKLLKCHN